MSLHDLMLEIENEVRDSSTDFESYHREPTERRMEKIAALIRRKASSLADADRERVLQEFEGMGPLAGPMNDSSITEIIVNGPDRIWCERGGRLELLEDRFASDLSYRNLCHRLLEESRTVMTSEVPSVQGSLRQFRLQMIGAELTKTDVAFCLRRHPENPWTFEKLTDARWGDADQCAVLRDLVRARMNFLVIGPTGSGKTSVLNACLQSLAPNERCVLIEDTLELKVPNSASMRLLTRDDPQGILKRIDQTELVRNALRLRPDRIVMGEVRGEEAKDFLMALSTGHAGSFGSLHASSAAQALIRLEMLIQLGAPHWALSAVRRLIQMSLNAIVVVGRKPDGSRGLEGIYQLCSLEENGILLEKTI